MVIRKTFILVGAVECIIGLLLLLGVIFNSEVVYKNMPAYKYSIVITLLISGVVILYLGIKNIYVNHKYMYSIMLLSVSLVKLISILEAEFSEVEIVTRLIAAVFLLIAGIVGLFISAGEQSCNVSEQQTK